MSVAQRTKINKQGSSGIIRLKAVRSWKITTYKCHHNNSCQKFSDWVKIHRGTGYVHGSQSLTVIMLLSLLIKPAKTVCCLWCFATIPSCVPVKMYALSPIRRKRTDRDWGTLHKISGFFFILKTIKGIKGKERLRIKENTK